MKYLNQNTSLYTNKYNVLAKKYVSISQKNPIETAKNVFTYVPLCRWFYKSVSIFVEMQFTCL